MGNIVIICEIVLHYKTKESQSIYFIIQTFSIIVVCFRDLLPLYIACFIYISVIQQCKVPQSILFRVSYH